MRCAERNVVPLIGAGVSKQSGNAYPNWRQLMDKLKERALAQAFISPSHAAELQKLLNQGQFLMAGESLRSDLPHDVFQTVLEEQFDPPAAAPAAIHRALFKLRPPLILTTNYDRLLEDAYAAEYHKAAKVFTYTHATEAQRPSRPKDFPTGPSSSRFTDRLTTRTTSFSPNGITETFCTAIPVIGSFSPRCLSPTSSL